MTTRIDELFRAARASSCAWSHRDVRRALEILAGRERIIDWEAGDEEWGRLVDAGGKVQAIVCALTPVCFGLPEVDRRGLDAGVACMTVASMSEPVFEVDRRLLEEIFGRPLSTNVDYSRLSIEDLWWATVS